MTHDHDHEQPVEGPEKPQARWRALALEFLVIFVGITASFWVDEWREIRQDTQTFHRILSEIYYDIRVDEAVLVSWAAANNEALVYAGDLVLRDGELPSPDELLRQLEVVFSDIQPEPTLGGYTRLSNTPLAIPVNRIQLALDEGFGLYLSSYSALIREVDQLRDVTLSRWSTIGIVPCRDELRGISIEPATAAALDLGAQYAPAYEAIRDQGNCLSEAWNHEVVLQVMEDEEFHLGLRRVIQIRENIATWLLRLRPRVESIRARLEDYLPDIAFPVDTLGLVGSATPAGWEVGRALPMRRVGSNDWTVDVRLADGEVKFAADRSWTMDWGAPRPWVAPGSFMGFEEGLVRVDEVFPSGTARFRGVNIPVRAGHYRVRFNTQSGEYSFERLND